MDISNPAVPFHAGSITNGAGGAHLSSPGDVYVSGNYAYVVGSNALEIVDVSNPAAPVHTGSITDGVGGALLSGPFDVYVFGNYAYVASINSNALEIVDVSNPATPVHAGSIKDGAGGALLNGPEGVYVSGNYAYVACAGSHALEIVDVSNPKAPVHAGSIKDGAGGALLFGAARVYVSGRYAYVTSWGSNALEIVDVSNPAAPVHSGSITNGAGGAQLICPVGVYVSGNYIYVTSFYGNALHIVSFDVTPPKILNFITTLNPAAINNPVTLNADINDISTGGSIIKSAEYSLDDAGWVLMSAVDGSFNTNHEEVTATLPAFTSPGVHSIKIRATDANDNTASEIIILPIYNPTGGFVTGGGWINSPAGAYVPTPTMTGKASFGFFSKYQKGANVPTGETEFQFKVADLNFHSDSYDWLVVARIKSAIQRHGDH